MKASAERSGLGAAAASPIPQSTTSGELEPASANFRDKRVAMIMFSFYPSDPRPRRAADALLKKGASIDLICLQDEGSPKYEILNGVNVRRLSIRHRRGGKLDYIYQYSAFILACAGLLAIRCLTRRYDLVYVHNMPDILVFSAVIPKLFGAKVVLDQHDPMPELMSAIFGVDDHSFYIRLLKKFEKLSLGFADLVLTVNVACQRIFTSRSCPPDKIGIVMNAPDGELFPFRTPRSYPAVRLQRRNFVVMYHGSLVERNGLDLAIRALVATLKSVPGVELRIYGKSTPFLESVLEEASSLGVRNSVRYLGPQRLEDLAEQIEQCDVGIIPNRRNAFTDINTPTRIFEYLALGKPVVAPSTRGIQDYFDSGSLFFFESGNAETLAQKIEYVFAHPADALEVAERGQQIYLAHIWTRERQALITLVGSLFKE